MSSEQLFSPLTLILAVTEEPKASQVHADRSRRLGEEEAKLPAAAPSRRVASVPALVVFFLA